MKISNDLTNRIMLVVIITVNLYEYKICRMKTIELQFFVDSILSCFSRIFLVHFFYTYRVTQHPNSNFRPNFRVTFFLFSTLEYHNTSVLKKINYFISKI